jgi:hypothetical protein
MATSPSNYQSIFDSDNAVESYKKRTGKDLATDPLLYLKDLKHHDAILPMTSTVGHLATVCPSRAALPLVRSCASVLTM